MDILIIGTGYVGLVTGASFAEMGHKVICLDIDEKKIAKLLRGEIPIYEPGLDELVKRNIKAKRLAFTTDYKKGIEATTICFLAVPTPSKEDGSCDTRFIESAVKELGKHLNGYRIIVNKSTAAPGTLFFVKKTLQEVLNQRQVNYPFDVISNPEFLKEGSAISDCMKPDRIVIGYESKDALQTMKQLYAPFNLNRERILEMDILSAELTKYAANAMLATRISFMNELAEICKRIGANINEVRKGIGSDARIGYSFLYAGAGYGGSCFPKDLRALCHLAEKKLDYKPLLLNAVEAINNQQKKVLYQNIKKYFDTKGGIRGKTFAIWGLSFKPDTDDMREAPSLTLIEQLQKEGAILRLYDPVSMENAMMLLKDHKNLVFCQDEFHAAEGVDAIALLTEWKQFRLVNFQELLPNMKNGVLFDGRNQYKPEDMKENGFDYIGIGVPDHIRN
ncbi:MAG: UDP-glucose/GDP-mannose dehydrogenase family protein [Chlamydiota bacterium]